MAVIEAIATTYLEADTASVTFSGIPATYEHLQLRMSVKDDRALTIDAMDFFINGDTTAANYTYHVMYAYDSTLGAYGITSNIQVFWITGSKDASAADYAALVLDIPDYASTAKNTVMTWTAASHSNSRTRLDKGSKLWDDTSAVTSLTFEPSNATNFVRGSEFTLYGLKSS
tara:strand:- start:540 stop:1055 length:516 start_codon:yes stop_codon:yes gene_type:complete